MQRQPSAPRPPARAAPPPIPSPVARSCTVGGSLRLAPVGRLLIVALLLAGGAGLVPAGAVTAQGPAATPAPGAQSPPEPSAAQEPDAPHQERGPAWARARDGVQVAATPHFDVWVPGDRALEAAAAEVADIAEAVLPTVEARLATPLADRVRLVLVPADQAPGPCEPRAAAFPTRRRIVLFAGPDTLDVKALPAFLAHEIGHQLTLDRWGALGNDRRLSEGVATWAAEPYWLAWRNWASMDQAAADLLATSEVAPLAEDHEGCLVAAERDVYYSAWSSFVAFLARHYGWDEFGQALSLPAFAEDHADYAAAFGRPLEDLTIAWEQELPRPAH